MKYFVGIDLGSTTTKALILDDRGVVVGRGITNSRRDYDVACQVALTEALINTRFWLVTYELERQGFEPPHQQWLLARLERGFRQQQYLGQLRSLADALQLLIGDTEGPRCDASRTGFKPVLPLRTSVNRILEQMKRQAAALFSEGASRKSDFFRDLAGNDYLALAEQHSANGGPPFDALVGLFDKAILTVENTPAEPGCFEAYCRAAIAAMDQPGDTLQKAVEAAASITLDQAGIVGTGYGRQRLPFPKERIRSEILCHGLGAHAMFPGTRTVLDIGGQDTKAIQVDENGIVTSFQMNDRCAAGCGRYLGYIADEMNLGLHQLGPLAARSRRPVRINSTCTVFAGAELRQRLALGQKREDILAGLHRAIILRAMSLLARSGGVTNQFTLTGGVAKNEAAVTSLRQLIEENYGSVQVNISPDSIYTGALGAALFAKRSCDRAASPRAVRGSPDGAVRGSPDPAPPSRAKEEDRPSQ